MVQEVEAGRAEESGFSLGVAVADDDAAGLDCGAAEPGHPRGVPAGPLGKVGGDKLTVKTAAGEFSAPLTELHDDWWNRIARPRDGVNLLV